MSNLIKLFRYENRVDLMLSNSQIRSFTVGNNSPLNNKIIRIHKGIDNEIRFRILNPDRKIVSVDHLSIRCRFINVENNERVLDKFASLTSTKGDVRLQISEGELVSLAPGFYNLVVTGEEDLVQSQPARFTEYIAGINYTTGQIVRFEDPGPPVTRDFYVTLRNHFSASFDPLNFRKLAALPTVDLIGDNIATPFYIDNAGNIVAVIEIVASADVTPVPTVEILQTADDDGDWRIANEVNAPTTFYAGPIAGSRIKNHINAVHTFSVQTTAFTGTLSLKGSLDLQPSVDIREYFPIDITSGTQEITFTNFTGITSHTFEANFLWIIFVYIPDSSLPDPPGPGFINKVLLR